MAESSIAREKRLFRLAAVEAIKNSHNAIKSVWTILFTGGTFALLNSFDHVVECSLLDPPKRLTETVGTGFHCNELTYLSGYGFLIYFGLIVVYVATFYRFYVGNIRVFDIRYNEAIEFVKNLAAKRPEAEQDAEYRWLLDYNDRWKKAENIYLMFKTLVIVYLTVSIVRPLKFEFVYLLLLVMDNLWILSNWFGNRIGNWIRVWFKKPPRTQYIFGDKFISSFKTLSAYNHAGKSLSGENKKIMRKLKEMFPGSALMIWGWNNFAWGLLLLFVLVPLGRAELERLGVHTGAAAISLECRESLLIVGLVLMLANCIFDLSLTWGFYNPRYRKLSEHLFRRPQTAPQAGDAS